MEALIKINDNQGSQAVNARELHVFLESKRDFSNWIKSRIEKYGLVENQDYEVFDKFGENPSGGRPSIEYALSVDAAKELSMLEGNEKGKLARRYFISVEREYKERMAQENKLIGEYKKILELQDTVIKALANIPKIETSYEINYKSKLNDPERNSHTVKGFVATAKNYGVYTTIPEVYIEMIALGWIKKIPVNGYYQPTEKAVKDNNLIKVKVDNNYYAKLTPKGYTFLVERYQNSKRIYK